MELSLVCLKQIAVMFILIIVGIICGKTGLIDKQTNSKLSQFVLNLVNPVLIFMSYQKEYTQELLFSLIISFLLGAASYLLIIIAIKIFYRKRKDEKAVIEQFAAVYSNCSFMGIPLINGLFGNEGVFLLTGYVTVFNIMVWTHGVSMFSKKRNRSETIKKVLTCPSVIATFLGIIFFAARITLPEIPASACNFIKDINTPLAMMCAGVTISSTKLKEYLFSKSVWTACMLRLILCPVLFWMVFRWFGINETVFMTILVSSACPAAATGTMFAIRFSKHPELSAVVFSASTVISAITLPAVILLGSI